MSAMTRACSTDDQEEAVKNLEEWAENTNFSLRLGTTIGKSPQTVILDHKYQDNFCYVNADGEIKIRGTVVHSEHDFDVEIKLYGAENEAEKD